MKTNILTAFAICALAMPASAQNYKVVITTTDGEKTEYETTGVKSIRFEEAPTYIEANYLIGAEYSSKSGNGLYFFTIGSSAPDEKGDPVEIGDLQLSLELTSSLSENYVDAKLPEGYYRAGSGANQGEFNLQKSGMWLRLAEGDDGVMVSPMIDGTVDVRTNEDNYEIRGEFTLLTGETVAVSYDGPIVFTPGLSENEEFTEDQNIAFEGAQERYYANWFYPFADDVTLELYTGDFAANGSQIEGYWLNMSLYMPKADDPKAPAQYLADGVYTVEPRDKADSYTNLPYTFEKGRLLDFWGQQYPQGSYITYKARNGRVMRAFIVDGSVTVSDNGSKIVVDGVTDNGLKIEGTYSGRIVLDNRNDSEKAPEIAGTIDQDLEFDFIDGTVAISYPLGDYIKKGVYQYTVMVTDINMTNGDFVTFEVSSDQEVLPDGTYTFNNEIAPFCGIKGYLDYGKIPIFSWYGNLDDVDEEGVQNIVAPFRGGTVTITTTGENTRKIVFDAVDEDGHRLTGTYEGTFINASANAPAKAPLLRPATK